ncbi:CHAT domain-containing protein [Nocardioides sp.]|uniref:CHAT domain-containing protein n=1 Tax=Nocardioides sp. TaxID=35761 RepID=UPI003D0B10D4
MTLRSRTTPAQVPPAELTTLALSRPSVALQQARSVLESSSDPVARSFAYQAAGIVHRENGEMTEAIGHLRQGLRAARRTGSLERTADVEATLGATLVMNGRTRIGLKHLDAAADAATGSVLATVLMRRAYILSQLGRHGEALTDMGKALKGIRAAGDVVWEGRALTNRGLIHLARGSLTRAESDFVRAGALLEAAHQELEAVDAVEHQGLVAFTRGDLPRALALYDEAARRYAPVAAAPPELAIDRSAVLLAAGLAHEAVSVIEEALAEPAMQPRSRAELLLAEANASLAANDPTKALAAATEARSLFRRQDRAWWADRADLAAIRARRDRGETGPALLRAGTAVAFRLQALRAEDAPHALLLAGRLATVRGDPSAHELLTAAARYQRNPSALVRATGWLASALDRDANGNTRGVYAACARGLEALDEHRMSLGSSELRALATRHGEELSQLATRSAVASGDARRILHWSERWRATALTQPPVRPRLSQRSRQAPGPPEDVEARKGAAAPIGLEQAIRSQRHQLSGVAGVSTRFNVPDFVDSLGADTFIELLEVEETLHAVVARAGRVRTQVVGPIGAALAAVTATRFALRQSARGRPTTLDGVGDRLQTALLGPAARLLGSGPVVISPSSRLHDTPWSLLPVLSERPVAVVPSAVMWQRAKAATPPAAARLVLVAGPGLKTGGAEVSVLADSGSAAVVLRNGAATVANCLKALDGASLAHIAAHGQFRPDSPMFSSLVMHDGPLTVHDLELLHRAPHRLVLSACDSGVMVPVGANELLGLASVLLSLGTAGIVSSIAEVNDEATVGLMLDVHAGLATGAGLAEVMLAARQRARGDLVTEATAAAFVALGV